jgi:hypothetical protein
MVSQYLLSKPVVVRCDSTVKRPPQTAWAAASRFGLTFGLDRAHEGAQEQHHRHAEHRDQHELELRVAQAQTARAGEPRGQDAVADRGEQEDRDQHLAEEPAARTAGPPIGEMPLVERVDIAWQKATKGRSPAIISRMASRPVKNA